MTDIDTGLNVWQMTSNHNRMIELQADNSPPRDGPVELAYYGSSAFKITSPRGVSVMIDPGIGKIGGRFSFEPEYWLRHAGLVSWWRSGRV